MWVERDWEDCSPDESSDRSEEAPAVVAERQNIQTVPPPLTGVRQRRSTERTPACSTPDRHMMQSTLDTTG
ncbi:hypothetical protein TKK_0016113 [Trichogramma kaykai]